MTGSSRLPPLATIPHDIVAVADYESYARRRMSASAWAYLNGGAADELTLASNTTALQALRLRPRVLADLKGAHTRVTLFGDTFDHPILLAPVAYQKLAHVDGELATVMGASAMRAGMVVSTQASMGLEDIARAAHAPLWFQLYIQHDREYTQALAERAATAGYRALVVTVDAPVNGVRNNEQRSGFRLPADIDAVNLRGLRPLPPQSAQADANNLLGGPILAAAPTWKDIESLVRKAALPVVLKGITHPEDALRALDCGASGLIVSNHGGRILDTMPASIDILPGVVEAVDGRAPVLFDGGIRRGTDIFKALALGASAILIGRPYIHGLATAGASGVAHVLHILRTELEIAMALTGRARLEDIDASALWL
ncbi:MAG TPA: alpha-hydroxy acid oxidase [Candidimonas sp.]|nr:alpha-hydroxy acid oxidase [Candidimonas sp.]